jgi:hypothetical protein
MNYILHYERLINRAPKERPVDTYTEEHHIIPRCMGGTDEDGLVYLTAEEHYIAHQLLVKIYPNHRGIVYAAAMMTKNSNGKRPNNKLFGWLRRRMSVQNKGYRSTRIVKKCETCKVEYKVHAYRALDSKFCSKNCTYKDTSKILLTCSQCKCEYSQLSSRRRSINNYCSFDCQTIHKNYLPSVKMICSVCKLEYNVSARNSKVSRFCSKQCMYTVNTREILTCIKCNTIYTVSNYRAATSKFCSKKCQNKPITC